MTDGNDGRAPAMTIDELRRLAMELAAGLPSHLDDVYADETTPEEIDAMIDAEQGPVMELARAADFDEHLLESARLRVDVGSAPKWSWLLLSASCEARRWNTPDEERARQLAGMACWGIPGSRHAFAPHHAHMALTMLDMVYEREARRLRDHDETLWAPSIDEVRSWLEDFATA